jgi:hypothetical protein
VHADLPLSLRRIVERVEEAARQALPEWRGVRAGADERRARSRRAIRTRTARYSLAVRWALTMAAVVAITMTDRDRPATSNTRR